MENDINYKKEYLILEERIRELERQQEINTLFKQNVLKEMQNIAEEIDMLKMQHKYRLSEGDATNVTANNVAAENNMLGDVTAEKNVLEDVTAEKNVLEDVAAETNAAKNPYSTIKHNMSESDTTQTNMPGSVAGNIASATKPASNINVKVIKKAEPKEKKDLEKKFGKNFMGIIASVLIIVSLVSFGGLVYRYLTDVVKIAIMYSISIILTVVGIVLMRKKGKSNLIFSAIAACGSVGIYVTSFIGCFAFDLYKKPVLLALVGMWLVLTCIASKYASRMFIYIFNIGLIISVFLDASGSSNFMWDVCGYLVGMTVIYILHRSNEYRKDFIFFVQIPVITLIFYAFENCNNATRIVMGIFNIAVLYADNFLYDIESIKEEKVNFAKVMWYISTMLSLGCAALLMERTHIAAVKIFFLVVLIITMIVYHIRYSKTDPVTHLMMFYLAVCLSIGFYNFGFVEQYIGLIVPAIILLTLGIKLGSKNYKYTGYAFMFLYVIQEPKRSEVWICTLIMLLVIIVLTVLLKYKYYLADKILITILAIITILRLSLAYANLSINIILPIFIMLLAIPYYSVNWETKEREEATFLISRILNIAYVVYGTLLVFGFYSNLIGDFLAGNYKIPACIVYFVFLAVNLAKSLVLRDTFDRYYELGTAVCIMLIIMIADNFAIIGIMAAAIILIAMAVLLFADYQQLQKCFIAVYFMIFAICVKVVLLDKFNGYWLQLMLGVLTIFYNTPFFRRNFETGEAEKGTKIFGHVINIILMVIVTVSVIYAGTAGDFAHAPSLSVAFSACIMIAMMIALYITNTKDNYDSAKEKEAVRKGAGTSLYVYICIKFTVMIIVVLVSIKAASFVLSIFGILFALSCIATGFKLKAKPFRIYGLVLSLISVIKIVLFDVKYSSSIMLPLGLFITGILCFGISFGYAKLEKMNDDD